MAFKNSQGKLGIIIIIINTSELVPKTKGLFTIKKKKRKGRERFKSYDLDCRDLDCQLSDRRLRWKETLPGFGPPARAGGGTGHRATWWVPSKAGRLLAGRSVLPDRRDGVSHRGLGVDIGGSQRAVARGAGWADRVLPPGLETRWIPGLVHTRTLRRGKTN